MIFLRVGFPVNPTAQDIVDRAHVYIDRLQYYKSMVQPIAELYVDGVAAKVGVEYLFYPGQDDAGDEFKHIVYSKSLGDTIVVLGCHNAVPREKRRKKRKTSGAEVNE